MVKIVFFGDIILVLLLKSLDHDVHNQGIRLASNFLTHPLRILHVAKQLSYECGFVHINVKAHPHTLPLIPHNSRRLVSCPSDASRGPVNWLCETSLRPWKAHNRMIENRVIRDARIVELGLTGNSRLWGHSKSSAVCLWVGFERGSCSHRFGSTNAEKQQVDVIQVCVGKHYIGDLLFMALDHDIDGLGIRLASNQCPHPLVIMFFMLHKN